MRVIGVTPAGRRRYLAALIPHLLRQRHVLDEHHWWLNTNDRADARFVEQVSAQHPEFFKVCRKEVRADLNMGENIWRFFPSTTPSPTRCTCDLTMISCTWSPTRSRSSGVFAWRIASRCW